MLRHACNYLDFTCLKKGWNDASQAMIGVISGMCFLREKLTNCALRWPSWRHYFWLTRTAQSQCSKDLKDKSHYHVSGGMSYDGITGLFLSHYFKHCHLRLWWRIENAKKFRGKHFKSNQILYLSCSKVKMLWKWKQTINVKGFIFLQ